MKLLPIFTSAMYLAIGGCSPLLSTAFSTDPNEALLSTQSIEGVTKAAQYEDVNLTKRMEWSQISISAACVRA